MSKMCKLSHITGSGVTTALSTLSRAPHVLVFGLKVSLLVVSSDVQHYTIYTVICSMLVRYTCIILSDCKLQITLGYFCLFF
jgi:hypothetical protein